MTGRSIPNQRGAVGLLLHSPHHPQQFRRRHALMPAPGEPPGPPTHNHEELAPLVAELQPLAHLRPDDAASAYHLVSGYEPARPRPHAHRGDAPPSGGRCGRGTPRRTEELGGAARQAGEAGAGVECVARPQRPGNAPALGLGVLRLPLLRVGGRPQPGRAGAAILVATGVRSARGRRAGAASGAGVARTLGAAQTRLADVVGVAPTAGTATPAGSGRPGLPYPPLR